MISDNGPKFTFAQKGQLTETYGFHQVTSLPYYPQANGQAEQTVHTIKNPLQNANDPFMVLLSYRATPLQWCNLKLLQGCKKRTDGPQPKFAFIPQWTHTRHFKELHDKYNSSKQNRICSLPPLPKNTPMWVQTENYHVSKTVVQPVDHHDLLHK